MNAYKNINKIIGTFGVASNLLEYHCVTFPLFSVNPSTGIRERGSLIKEIYESFVGNLFRRYYSYCDTIELLTICNVTVFRPAWRKSVTLRYSELFLCPLVNLHDTANLLIGKHISGSLFYDQPGTSSPTRKIAKASRKINKMIFFCSVVFYKNLLKLLV